MSANKTILTLSISSFPRIWIMMIAGNEWRFVPGSVWALVLVGIAAVVWSFHLVRWAAFLLVSDALFGLVFLFVVIAAGCSCRCLLVIIEIWISSSLLILRQEVLWKTLFSLLRREHSFELSYSFSDFGLIWSVIEERTAEKSAIFL